MAIRESDVIVATAPYIPGYRVVKVIGISLGITVRSRGLGGRFLAGLRSLVGGEIQEFTELAEQARRQAIERMIDIAVGVLSLVSILAVARTGLPIVPFKNQLQALLTAQYIGIAVQPLVSFLFHPGASMFLRAMQTNGRGLRGLAITIIAHTYMDSFTLYLNYMLYGLLTTTGELTIASSAVYFSTIVSISIVLFLIGLNKIKPNIKLMINMQ
jgi:hypothetical protein